MNEMETLKGEQTPSLPASPLEMDNILRGNFTILDLAQEEPFLYREYIQNSTFIGGILYDTI